jgi:hypothetical protein
MERDMQIMFITIALLTQKSVTTSQFTLVQSRKYANCWPSLFTHSCSLLATLKHTLAHFIAYFVNCMSTWWRCIKLYVYLVEVCQIVCLLGGGVSNCMSTWWKCVKLYVYLVEVCQIVCLLSGGVSNSSAHFCRNFSAFSVFRYCLSIHFRWSLVKLSAIIT